MGLKNKRLKFSGILYKSMKLKEEYAPTSAKEEEKVDKTVLSDDAFAVCDFIERLINKVEHARMSMMR